MSKAETSDGADLEGIGESRAGKVDVTDLNSSAMPPLSMLAHAGAMVGTKHRLESVIGYGGMGSVWMATHVHLGQRVAIKIVSLAHSGSPEARQRFDFEAKSAARINSRHAVQIFDNGELDDGTPYIIMEYLEGESLEQRVLRDGAMSLEECGRVLVHVGRALGAAHGMKLIHRDMKPANIFLTRTPDDDGFVAKLLDFGIAKFENEEASATTPGLVVGTPHYMSPEQARGLKTDYRSDLYSLGAVAYFMLTGRMVFEAQTMAEMARQLCRAPLPKVSKCAPGLPLAIDTWFERACSRRPEDRFQDVQEMVSSFCRAAGLSMTGSKADAAISGPTKGILGGVAILVFIVTGLFWWRWYGHSQVVPTPPIGVSSAVSAPPSASPPPVIAAASQRTPAVPAAVESTSKSPARNPKRNVSATAAPPSPPTIAPTEKPSNPFADRL